MNNVQAKLLKLKMSGLEKFVLIYNKNFIVFASADYKNVYIVRYGMADYIINNTYEDMKLTMRFCNLHKDVNSIIYNDDLIYSDNMVVFKDMLFLLYRAESLNGYGSILKFIIYIL